MIYLFHRVSPQLDFYSSFSTFRNSLPGCLKIPPRLSSVTSPPFHIIKQTSSHLFSWEVCSLETGDRNVPMVWCLLLKKWSNVNICVEAAVGEILARVVVESYRWHLVLFCGNDGGWDLQKSLNHLRTYIQNSLSTWNKRK